MEIRVAGLHDMPGASAVQHAVVPDDHPYEYAQNIRSTSTANLVAVQSGMVVGFISVLIGAPNPAGRNLWERLRPYLAFIGVLPALQRQHVGVELVRRALQVSDSNATSGLWLECSARSAGFFEKIGCSRMTSDAVQQYTGLLPMGLVYRLTGNPVVG